MDEKEVNGGTDQDRFVHFLKCAEVPFVVHVHTTTEFAIRENTGSIPDRFMTVPCTTIDVGDRDDDINYLRLFSYWGNQLSVNFDSNGKLLSFNTISN